jgi:hypothetical protein
VGIFLSQPSAVKRRIVTLSTNGPLPAAPSFMHVSLETDIATKSSKQSRE